MSTPLLAKIEALAQRPGLHPETLHLLQLAAEAQRSGVMPKLPVEWGEVIYPPWTGPINHASPTKKLP